MYKDHKFVQPLAESDYTYLWWAYGLRGVSPEGSRIMAVRTGKYGMAMDVEKASFTSFGSLPATTPAKQALMEDNDVVLQLPESKLTWQFIHNGKTFTHSGSKVQEDTRIVESGRFVQRYELANIRFLDPSESSLESQARMEIVALPDYLSLVLEWTPQQEIDDIEMVLKLDLQPEWKTVDSDLSTPDQLRVLNDTGEGLVFSVVSNDAEGQVELQVMDSQLVLKPAKTRWAVGNTHQIALRIAPTHTDTRWETLSFINPLESTHIEAKAFTHLKEDDQTTSETGFNDPVEVSFDPLRGWYQVHLTDQLKDVGTDDPQHYERVQMTLSNPEDYPKRVPLLFLKDYGAQSITGLTPMIRDKDGNPTGLPVQISKNWHGKRGEIPPYSGQWFHGFTVLTLPPQSSLEFEFTMAYAYWGGVPAASHAQLSLIGWGGNQLWEQVAIGSWGESITYDPDIGLGRAMIDDVRPLLVTAFGGKQYSWTENVGGGDFLVHHNEQIQRQFLSRMRTFHKNYGPNLTEATYSGITSDGNMTAEITVSTPRTDDINRVYHHVRYEVLKPTPVLRLAFYQLGADKYNDHQFKKMAYGNEEGLIEEWEPYLFDIGYERRSFPVQGETPWFSMHEGQPNLNSHGGAWANRGLVIRSWDAVIEGKPVSIPHVSVFRTHNGVPSVNLELSAPQGTEMLMPGDFIEFEVELLILPQHAEDYYGPNQALLQLLEESGNTWKPVFHEATANLLQIDVRKGELVENSPAKIRVDRKQTAEFDLVGGLGYVPMTFTGLKQYWNWVLEQWIDDAWKPVDQSQIGNDYWQTYYDPTAEEWEITFNVPVNKDDPLHEPKKFRFSIKEKKQETSRKNKEVSSNTLSLENIIPQDYLEMGYKHPFSDDIFQITPEVFNAYETDTSANALRPIFYETLDYLGQPTRAFAYLGMPANIAPGEKVPAVVLVHGGGGTAYLEWVRIWNMMGFAAISMDLEGHYLDLKTRTSQLHSFSGPQRQGVFDDIEKPIKDQWFYQAVADVILAHNVLRDIEEIDSSKIGVTGISWGGVVTSYLAGIDNRFAFAIPVYGAGFTDAGTGYWGKAIRENPLKSYWDSKNTLSEAKMPMLWVSSDHDGHFPLNTFSKSYETSLLNNPQTRISIDPNMEHSHSAGWSEQEIIVFANSIVRDVEPLIEITESDIHAGDIKVAYKEHRPLVSAKLMYITDPEIMYDPQEYSNALSVWHALDITSLLKDGSISMDVPADATYLYINLIDTYQNIISTKLMKVAW